MFYGIVWNRKIHKWVVYNKSTGKIIGKHDLKTFAEKQLNALLEAGEDNKGQRGGKRRL